MNEDSALKLINSVFKLSLNKIGDASNVKGYSNIQFESMEQTTEIINDLIPQLKKGRSYRWLSKLLGDVPAEAFLAKNISHFVLFPNLLALNVCYSQLGKPNNFITVSNYFGSANLFDFFYKRLGFANLTRYKKGVFSAFQVFYSIFLIIHVLYIICKFIFKRGVTIRKPIRKKYSLITEFIHPKRLNGTSYDADYFIDNKRVKNSDVLFFLTNNQLKILQSNNYSLNEIRDLFNSKKYSLLILDEQKYSVSSIVSLLQHLISFIVTIFLLTGIEHWYKVLFSTWKDYLDFSPLFDNAQSKSLLYFTFPNGHTSFRLNDGLITGMCRKYGIQSIGIQSRTIYTTKYEDCFDCFDKYLSWGEAWENISTLRVKYINETIQVGCLYTDDLRSALDNKEVVNYRKQWLADKKYLVSVFDSDIGLRSHYTFEYARSFILNIGKLAQKHLDCSFIIKTKNPDKNKLYLQDTKIKELFNEPNRNIQFLNKGRNDYSYVLRSSDIVIAIGFTTPGFEALTIGKRAIYYSLLKNGGCAFVELPNFVVTDLNRLEYVFEKSLMDYNDYSIKYSDEIELLNQNNNTEIKQNIINALIN
jgi:polysaccharide biosynthesis PFTS motif protein